MELLGAQPGKKIISYFIITIVVGTFLLRLPACNVGTTISFTDALFTSTSAVCVTGLVVVDTASKFTLFGQLVILFLIQLGGLGIMTFATSLLALSGIRLPFIDRLGLTQDFSTGGKTVPLLQAVFITTMAVELIGAIALFFVFRPDYPIGEAAYHAIFHSISAFCNAGFSTLPNGLEGYRGNIPAILIFSVLIILGGLGFIVIREMISKIENHKFRLSLHTKICLATTAILLVGGMAGFFVAEYSNLFAHSSLPQSLANAFFQSVTSRTAGFNTLPQTHLTEVSLQVTIILMLIGACPGSTGGGIKTTTFAVIMLVVYNRFLGRSHARAFRRSISADSVTRAVTVLLLAIIIMFVIFTLLMFAEDQPVGHNMSHGWFVDNLFEVVSAFGTVGLSLGRSGHLDTAGKYIIIIAMFIGRVGLLTLAFSLARPIRKGEIVYLDEPVMIG